MRDNTAQTRLLITMNITRNKLFHLSYFAFDPGCNKKMIASQTWGQNDRLIVDTNSFFAKSRTLHLLGMATCHWQELNWCGLLATALSPRVSLLSKNTRGKGTKLFYISFKIVCLDCWIAVKRPINA